MAARRILKPSLLVALLLLSGHLPSFAVDSPRHPTIAILPFSCPQNLPSHKWLGEYIPSLLTSDLARVPTIRIAERTQIDALLREIELSLSGAVDEGTVRGGSFAVATHYVLGTFAIQEDRIRIDVRVTDVESGTILDAFSEIGSTVSLAEVTARIASGIARALALEMPERQGIRPDIGLRAHRTIFRANELWSSLPFHELHPRRQRNKVEYQAMVDQLLDLIEESPRQPLAYFLCGEFHLQLGLSDDARGYFEALQSPDMDPVLGSVGLGDLLRFSKALGKAAESYAGALALDDGSAAAHYGMAKCLIESGSFEKAAFHAVRLLELRPDLLVAQGLIDILVSAGSKACGEAEQTPACRVLTGVRLLKAMHFSDAARALGSAGGDFPDLHLIPFARGVEGYIARDYSQAEESLKRSITLHPAHAQSHLYLGHVFFDSQRFGDALPYYQAYIRLSKEGSDFEEIRKRIQICSKKMQGQ